MLSQEEIDGFGAPHEAEILVEAVALQLAAAPQEGGQDPLCGIDLQIRQGELVCLLGPPGCGKTGLLRVLAGLEVPASGRLRINGRTPEVARAAGACGYLCYRSGFDPWRSLGQNLDHLLKQQGQTRLDRESKVRNALQQVDLQGERRRFLWQLIDEKRLRAALARFLVVGAKLLLLDAPFAGLDVDARERMTQALRQIWAQTGVTVIFVGETAAEAVRLATRIVVMGGRPARIQAVIENPLPFERPREMQATAEFQAVIDRVQAALDASST